MAETCLPAHTTAMHLLCLAEGEESEAETRSATIARSQGTSKTTAGPSTLRKSQSDSEELVKRLPCTHMRLGR